MIQRKTTSYTIAIVMVYVLLIINVECLKNFGMNKPHYIMHLGDRRPVSTNIGFGYWADNRPLRMRYANTQDEIYIAMNMHDGETFFQENVTDTRSSIESIIKYQLNSDHWETQIQIDNVGSNLTTWFVCYSVENNDYKLVDHEKYSSYIYFVASKSQQKSSAKVNQMSLMFPNQTLTLRNKITNSDSEQELPESSSHIKKFGLTANISETYGLFSMAETVKHLIRVSRGEEQLDQKTEGKTDKDKKILEWEKKQLEFIQDDKWEDKNFVVMFLYGTLGKGQKATLYLTNSTKSQQFSDSQFSSKRKSFLQTYLPPSPIPLSEQTESFITHTISNLYAGLTFYYGRLYTQNSLTVHRQDYSYSFTPSRLIFPRSFLWDDGFHQSVIVHYHKDIVIDILQNWVNKVDIFGWIGREQIRGSEISSMMPDSRFVFQDWFQMNPPTLIMSILTLIQQQGPSSSPTPISAFLQNNYHKLQLWYSYFKNTQSHQSLEYQQTLLPTDRFYRWHCKDECSKGNFMGSGLDDYPRRNQDVQIAKQHVDLLSWLYFLAEGLQEIGDYLEKSTKLKMEKEVCQGCYGRRNRYTRRVQFYKKEVEEYMHKLYTQFFDQTDSLFKDIVVAKSDLFVQKFVNKIGYINLFPFFTGMLSQKSSSAKYEEKRILSLKKVLQIMSDEKLLFSKDGLRSLSMSDPLYGTDENYWRGAVWMPINFMVLRACKKYYWDDEPVKEQVRQFYHDLRERLIDTVMGTYKTTGYLFENYYEGRGHRGYPFYGWTATIVNIITEKY